MNLHFEFTGSYRQHNAALVYFRTKRENLNDPFLSHGLVFPNDKPVEVATVYWDKGGGWGFDETKMVPWSWKELVAQLDTDSIRIVVQGENRLSCGLVRCYVAPTPHSYDHTRHAKLRSEGRPLVHTRLPVWDFVIERDDGTAVRLEPQPSTPNVQTFEHEGSAVAEEPPLQVYGWGWGRKSYTYYKNAQMGAMLKFDTLKGTLLPPPAKYRQGGSTFGADPGSQLRSLLSGGFRLGTEAARMRR